MVDNNDESRWMSMSYVDKGCSVVARARAMSFSCVSIAEATIIGTLLFIWKITRTMIFIGAKTSIAYLWEFNTLKIHVLLYYLLEFKSSIIL